ncbi:acyl-CoA carboxylase epsilon subunit [Streptomyces sp. NPDC006552]|uniref:acyl-CoA carboxylase epsilon subunit n=1 Tax=Streptomyces sp. NPDC006552 TaxID=3157179 RepID=UPI00339F91CB
MRDGECVLRVERGRADPDELAAVAAVLFARGRAGRAALEPVSVRRPRPWRPAPGYSAPGAWR